jgi:septum formation protein
MRLVLASASPRRRELLTGAGFEFDVLVTDVDESSHPGENPEEYVRRIARQKSRRGLDVLIERGVATVDTVVLGADTAVVVDGEVLGKPESDEHARRMLARLSGRAHSVLTALSLRSLKLDIDACEATEVWFSKIGPAEVAWYVASGEGRDKAGGYAIQGFASRFIPRIHGSYSNVVGLPVEAFCRLLRQFPAAADAVASGG